MAEPSYGPGAAISSVNAQQSEEEQALVKKCLRLFQISAQAKRNKELVWRDHWEFYLGRQWMEARPRYRASEVFNYTFAAIQSALPILTDNRPRFTFLPDDVGDTEFATYLEKLIDSDWHRKGWNDVVSRIYNVGMIWGTAIPYLKWDPFMNSGTGDIRFDVLEPFYAYPAPWAVEINDGSCPWFIEARPVPVSRVKAAFPDKADLINAELTQNLPSKYRNEGYEFTDSARIINLPTDKSDADYAFGTDQDPADMTVVYDVWMDDDTMEEVEIQMCDDKGKALYAIGGKPMTKKQLQRKYPNGRHIIIAGGVLLRDGENEYKDGMYPYARYYDHYVSGEFWGIGELDMLKGPQRVINRTVSHAMDTLTTVGNPIWIVDTGAVDTDNITNAPGLIVEKSPGSDVRREMGLPMPGSVNTLYDQAVTSFDRIFGSNEVSLGLRPPGVTSGVAIDSLQEAAQTRLRQKARNMEITLNQLAQMYVSRVFQFYSSERFFALVQDGQPPEVFRFKVEQEPEFAGWYVATVQKMGRNATGKLVPTEEQKKFKTKGIFDVKSTVGSNLPFAKAARSEKATQLFQLGVIDAEELLRAVEWPGWEKVLQRIQEKQTLAQAQQAQPVAQ